MQAPESIKKRIQKILDMINHPNTEKELVDASKRVLDSLLAEYDLTIESFQSAEIKTFFIDFEYTKESDLLEQLGFYVDAEVRTWINKSQAKKSFILLCTDLQFKEFEMLRRFYSFRYRKDFETYLSNFNQAWLIKNNLAIIDDSGIGWDELTEEEQNKIKAINKTAGLLKFHHYNKLIE